MTLHILHKSQINYIYLRIPDRLKSLIKQQILKEFGTRLQSLVFFGSRVKNCESSESDLDMLVVLNGPIHLWDDTHRSVQALYDIQLAIEYPIHIIPVDAEKYREQAYALFRKAHEEGIVV